MPKWKKDATEFTVSMSYHPTRGAQCIVPKPVVDTLGQPEKVTFKIEKGSVHVEPSNERSTVQFFVTAKKRRTRSRGQP